MTTDLQEEFQLLANVAMRCLKGVDELEGYQEIFSFWELPSFSPSYRCTLYSPRNTNAEGKSIALFAIWRSDLDLEKVRSPVERLRYPKELEPTLYKETILLTGGEIQQIQSRFQGIAIPTIPATKSGIVLDGTRFEFRSNRDLFGLTLYWSSDHPKEWEPFTATVGTIVNELDMRRREMNASVEAPNQNP